MDSGSAITSLRNRSSFYEGVALYGCLLLCWLTLAPGLSGTFLFDDFPNLNRLNELNREPTFYMGLQYVLGGISSALGRPLSLASFAVQHASWPQHPEDFLYVNLLLHLLNGALLFWCSTRLQQLGAARSAALPATVTFLWLSAPLQTGTVLYVVQRMAILATSCMLTGLLLYVAGRQSALEGRSRSGYSLMTAGVVVGLGLGTLAKENAVLFTLLVLVIEATLLAAVKRPPNWGGWSIGCLWLPIASLVAYLVLRIPGFQDEFVLRGYTAAQRLMTEARLLDLYLYKLLVPSPGSVRVLYDDVLLSTSLLQPWTTLPSVIGWIALLVGAVAVRRKAPLFSFGVLWFVACHLLESTIIPLELAFDHRNYLAIAGPIYAATAYFVRAVGAARLSRIRPLLRVGGASYLFMVALGALLSSELWGKPLEQARYWVQRQPESLRALHHYGDVLVSRNMTLQAAQVYERAAAQRPNNAVILLSLIELGCHQQQLPVPSREATESALKQESSREVFITLSLLQRLVTSISEGRCTRYPIHDIAALVRTAMVAPHLSDHRATLLWTYSLTAESAGNTAEALRYLDESIRLRPRIPLLQQAVVWSLNLQNVDEAHRYLELAESSTDISWIERWTHRREIAGLHQLIDLYESAGETPTEILVASYR